MADKKVSALSAITNLSADDLIMVVNDPAGTPASKKVTVGNLFGNVVPATTHKSLVTFAANTNHTGTTATFSSNVTITSTLTVNSHNIVVETADRMQVANTTLLVNDRVQVANNNTALALKSPIASPTFTGTLTTPKLIVSVQDADPSNSNAISQGVPAGTIAYSNTYLYIATDDNTIKRIALSTF